MKKYIFIILAMSSCITFKQWQKKGIENGWYDTVPHKIDSTLALKVDTAKVNDLIKKTDNDIAAIIDSVNEANKTKPCDTIIKIVEKHIHYYINKNLKQGIDTIHFYKEDSLIIKNKNLDLKIYYRNGKLMAKSVYKSSIITIPLNWYEKYWWLWLIAGGVLGFTVFFLAKKAANA